MPTIRTSITVRSPLVFNERRPGGQFHAGASYVPGSVLRGALARQMLDAEEPTREASDFWKLFTAPDAPLFRNAYPAEKLLPATAFSCKAESGFLADYRHGVFDSLVDRLCCEELRVCVPYLPRCNDSEHKGMGERVEGFGGFCTKGRDGRFMRASVPMHLTTRVALNRRRKVAEEGLLYSPVVISEGFPGAHQNCVTFYGTVAVKTEEARLIEHWLPQLTHIGSGVARGFGRVNIFVDRIEAEDVAGRLNAFNRRVTERWRLWEQLPRDNNKPLHTPDKGKFFTVMLLSDTVLRTDGWTPALRLEPHLLGDVGSDLQLVRCYATPDYRGGWNTAWGLPKDTELVVRMGSVYVYYAKEISVDFLRTLEEQGVGERRAEGFGQVRVCDEFHLEIQEIST